LPSALESQPRNLSRSSAGVEHALRSLTQITSTRKKLLEWYRHELSTHFHHFILPHLHFWQEPVAVDQAATTLSRTVHILQQAQALYFSIGDPQALRRESRKHFDDFMAQAKRDFHATVLHALPRQRVHTTLVSYLYQTMAQSLKDGSEPSTCILDDHCRCTVTFALDVLAQLHHVGLGGSQGQRAFAHAVHRLMQGPAIQRRCFQVDWNGHKCIVPRLRAWIHETFVPALEQAVAALSGDSSMFLPTEQLVSAGLNSFGRLRTDALLDYVCTWPHSEAAVLDIREYVGSNGAPEKAHLCASFSQQIHRRLLHAGTSTTEILSVYINVIHVFRLLDSRGVLLEKVAIPIRSYLRSREDTASTIAASFLIDANRMEAHDYDHDKICIDIAKAVNESDIDAQEDRVLNWDDMEWLPDPIDAGPTYRSSKSDDVVAYIIALFEPDDFIKAFSTALGLHLLQGKKRDLSNEIRLVELLKSRLDASKLQHAEVMLRDMHDSATLNRRIDPNYGVEHPVVPPTPKEVRAAIPDEGIAFSGLHDRFKDRVSAKELLSSLKSVATRRRDLYFPKRVRNPSQYSEACGDHPHVQVKFEAKILSRFFWPQLRGGDFKIPHQIRQFKLRYEQEFAQTSGQRRLVWKPALDTATLHLELADRIVEEKNVEVWKLSIIDAFAKVRQGDDDEPPIIYDETVGVSVEQLMDGLHMPEEYVQSGISFWLTRRLLYEITTGRYAVLERLDMDVEFIAEPSQLEVEEAGGLMTDKEMLRQNAETYQNFILSMLQNQGAKEVEGPMGITNLLKMVMQGFPYGDAEILWLLGDMERQGKVMRQGDAWGVAG
jgi:anaphase-promoting complex subunit 2